MLDSPCRPRYFEEEMASMCGGATRQRPTPRSTDGSSAERVLADSARERVRRVYYCVLWRRNSPRGRGSASRTRAWQLLPKRAFASRIFFSYKIDSRATRGLSHVTRTRARRERTHRHTLRVCNRCVKKRLVIDYSPDYHPWSALAVEWRPSPEQGRAAICGGGSAPVFQMGD